MDRPLLNDKNEYPDDAVLSKYLENAKKIWDEFVNTVSTDFPSMSFEWNYYKDGNSWLCKLVKKKKTICWISIWENFFKITFYFTEKYETDIGNLDIAQELKDAFHSSKNIGKLRPCTIEVKSAKSLKNVYRLIDYKSSIK